MAARWTIITFQVLWYHQICFAASPISVATQRCQRHEGSPFSAPMVRAMHLYKQVLKHRFGGKPIQNSHVMPFASDRGIRHYLFAHFPKAWPQYSKEIPVYVRKATDLINDLHGLDQEYFGFRLLKGLRKRFVELNEENHRDCLHLLSQVPKEQPKNHLVLTEIMERLCHCVDSAPGNVRPGFAAVNQIIGTHLDPMLKGGLNSAHDIKEEDLTRKSIHMSRKYGVKYCGGVHPKAYIRSSDQLKNVGSGMRPSEVCQPRASIPA